MVDDGIHVVCVSLKELFARDGNTLNAFGGRDRDAVRVALADYLARRLRMSIMTRMRSNIAIEAMSVRRPHHRHGSGRGRGGKDDAGGGGLVPTTPFVFERTDCRASSSSSGAGRMPTLEVILRASSVVVSSSKPAALATAPVNNRGFAHKKIS